jgi:hypothetical protein
MPSGIAMEKIKLLRYVFPSSRPPVNRLPPTLRLLSAGVIFSCLACSALLFSPAAADSVKPVHYGPYLLNQVDMLASPAGHDFVLSNGFYHFQIGWIEPLADGTKGIFQGTYFETDGSINLSPYYVNLGTTFNLKPMRYLETGLTYNRLLYNNSMVAFKGMPEKKDWAPAAIMSINKEPGGADVFTFQGNITVDIGRAQFFIYGSRSQWDVDAAGRDFVYDYVDDFLIKSRDRVNYGLAQIDFDMRPLSLTRYVSYTGFGLRDQYWRAEGTDLEKNLVSGGITGFRIGRNSESQRRGLDLSFGYWTRHPQIPASATWAEHWVILADWKWNIQVLNL